MLLLASVHSPGRGGGFNYGENTEDSAAATAVVVATVASASPKGKFRAHLPQLPRNVDLTRN